MLQAFIIVLREGFESFLIVAIIIAYLQKTGRSSLLPAVYAGIGFSVFTSAAAGYLLMLNANEPLWEGIMGLVSAVLISWFVVHMWRTAPRLKQEMEAQLTQKTAGMPPRAAWWGAFLFTAFMITREGMETALLLIQIHDVQVVSGIALGILAAAGMALLWIRLGHLINLKLFFQVTALYLLLFVAQVLIYSFHEFTEAGFLPYSEALHEATEPFSGDGIIGKWISLGIVAICAIWLCWAWVQSKRNPPVKKTASV